ncbi:PREDICTED: MLX-interacting protein isoform X2 [Vollenhovia emeryi]|uniref:MLX-interacting protein isoform X2 n=1 Tax=Vollenhovia emeryi TaxID=411798 RepID=UPI0005F55A65|nr:PREDICTED: MLX-interacting protein isoform X2 [Vollenhovia emeryi]
MQAELIYHKLSAMTSQGGFHRAGNDSELGKNGGRDPRETIHSGHFMVSDFEAEAQDDEDDLAVPVPEQEVQTTRFSITVPPGSFYDTIASSLNDKSTSQQLSIETSLNKLFQCMSLAYRQKLTSPKWNRFKGIRLRWKDKIRLNNVIWRCWHMQFILKQNTLVCQFASPLDVDTHNKPEAVVLEGKYWKRKLKAVTAEYKKWRMFYRNKLLGWTNKDGTEMMESMDMLDWGSGCRTIDNFGGGAGNAFGNASGAPGGESMMVDEDYMELMTDTLFSTISSNQPIYFPDPREIARGTSLADFIQPSLGPLQPNLDDFMDTLEPLQEFLNTKLATVPEEDDMFRNSSLNTNYSDLDLMTPINQMNEIGGDPTIKNEPVSQQQLPREEQGADMQNLQYITKIYTQPQPEATNVYRNNIAMSEDYALQPNFEASVTTNQPIRDKTNRGSTATLSRNSCVIQQSQQQQQQSMYQATTQQQNSDFQSQQPQSYAMEIQAVRLTPVQNQSVQIATLNDQSAVNVSQLPAITAAAVQNLVTVQHNFVTQAVNSQLQSQHQAIRPLPTATPMASKPYKIVQPQQQCYKFPNLVQNLNAQQCKFSTNSFKTLPTQQVVSVSSTEQPPQPQILLQCRPSSDLDRTASTLPKLLPHPTTSNMEKEEVFAIPKYQGRSRSRSSSSLTAPRIHPPPLVSAVSDPALNVNNNVLLAHLLTNKVAQIATKQHITTPVTQTIQTSSIQQTQPQQQTVQPSTAQQILLNANDQTHQSHSSPIGSPKDSSSNAHSPQALNLSPQHSPMSTGSPLSPSYSELRSARGYDYMKHSERGQYKEQRRVGHIHAEQKRRYNIKNGFDMLHRLIPQISQNPNSKTSKAAMLQKGADYIRQLKTERHQLKEEMDSLRQQIECLNTSISNCQSMLPATGAPVSRHRSSKMKEMFDEYVRVRTQQNWKFWIFSILLEPLLLSFNASVSTANIDDLYKSTILWVEQHCSLVDLRPAVLNSLRSLCTATDILTDPTRLPEEALAAVNQTERRRSTQ